MSIHGLNGVAIITGAASGIARATSIAFVNAGCRQIHLGDVNDEGLQKTRKMLLEIASNADVSIAHVDISNDQSVQDFVDGAVERYGRIDYACNIAGIVPPRTSIEDTSLSTFDRVVDVNAYGTFLCHRAEIRQMLKQEPSVNGTRGSIVSTSSMAGLNASPGVTPYSSTKFAIVGMVKTDALDYGRHGIRVNAICPGFTDTEALHAMSTAEQREAIARTIPVQRLGLPLEVGQGFVFLVSDYASYVNGMALVVDGGALLHRQA